MSSGESNAGRLADRPLLNDHPTAFRISIALWVLAGLLYIGLLIPSVEDFIQSVDDWVHDLAVTLETEVGVFIAKVFDFLGSSWVISPVIIGVLLWFLYRRDWVRVWYWAIAMVVSQLLIGPIKELYARPRPVDALVETTGFSFPSGHATATAAVAVALVIAFVPAGPKRRNLEMLAIVFTVLMCMSRIYLRAHWLSDVLAGAAAGAAVAVVAAGLIHIVDGRRAL